MNSLSSIYCLSEAELFSWLAALAANTGGMRLDQIIKCAALLASIVVWLVWNRKGTNLFIWQVTFCLATGLFCIAELTANGRFDFNAGFYGVLFLASLLLLARRFVDRRSSG